MNQERLQTLLDAFQKRFGGAKPFVARAPGRVNIIGEHTDYNQGFVLPCALSFDMLVAARPRADETVVVHSMDMNADASFPLDSIDTNTGASWVKYLKGVAHVLQDEGHELRGMDMVVQGDVPIGSGLSSSAALEIATITAFQHAAGLEIPGPDKARMGKRVENEVIGVQSGIMDQFISALGRAGHALFLDCRSLEYHHIPFDVQASGLRLVVADTRVPHNLKESVYNDRVAECREAVGILAQFLPGVESLRDVTFDQFQVYQPKLPEVIRKRARHVVSENERVLGAVQALRAGAFEGLGHLMNQSHDSLRHDYECTGIHLDAMVEESRRIPGVLGSRMTGGGFGGCTVSLVREESVEAFLTDVPARYTERTQLAPELYVVTPGAGAGIVA